MPDCLLRNERARICTYPLVPCRWSGHGHVAEVISVRLGCRNYISQRFSLGVQISYCTSTRCSLRRRALISGDTYSTACTDDNYSSPAAVDVRKRHLSVLRPIPGAGPYHWWGWRHNSHEIIKVQWTSIRLLCKHNAPARITYSILINRWTSNKNPWRVTVSDIMHIWLLLSLITKQRIIRGFLLATFFNHK